MLLPQELLFFSRNRKGGAGQLFEITCMNFFSCPIYDLFFLC